MRDFTDELKQLRSRLDEAHHYLRIDETRQRFAQLEAEVQKPDLWDDQDRARQVNSAYARARDHLEVYDRLAAQAERTGGLPARAREPGGYSRRREPCGP